MDWLSLASPAIAVVGTLGGVVVTQRAAAKQAERARQVARASELESRLRDAALVVTKLFRREIDETAKFRRDRSDSDVSRQMSIIDAQLEERFHGPAGGELKVAISLVPDAAAREHLMSITRAYAQSLSVEGGLAGGHSTFLAPILLQLGCDISAAYARGERPDAGELKRLERFTSWPSGRSPQQGGPEQAPST
ncbi:hypothetical protein D8M34_05760 [Microbacterium sp. HSID17254]|uniref:hypothetical protein n=1 Tax=Microbacterium sp. HSID17254 TaxID=2419509 RepID=UPI000F865390|nr:hypothetical protein [Microbacterium sp. HSID17254]RUQ06974.1 hypothetical protein D8M34_05760 [Microbacterium sp. HSID17254]